MLRSTPTSFALQPPIGLSFGKQVGTLLAGHNIMIPGKPERFTPILCRHFMMIETAMRTPADALYFSHCIATYFSYPNRTDLVAICNQDAQTRLKASLFWGKYLSTQHNFNDLTGIAVRFLFLMLHLGLLFPWFVVASCAPGMVHQVLATGADITWKKYETTAQGNPDYQLYQNHINEMQRLAVAHQQAANTAFFCPMTCAIALIWLIFWRASSGSKQQSSSSNSLGRYAAQQQQGYGAPGGAGYSGGMPAFNAPSPFGGQ